MARRVRGGRRLGRRGASRPARAATRRRSDGTSTRQRLPCRSATGRATAATAAPLVATTRSPAAVDCAAAPPVEAERPAAPVRPQPVAAPTTPAPTRRSWAASRQRWRWSRPSACTVISRPVSIRSAPSRPATRRSTSSGSQPPLTPELQARIPARLLRLYVAGETLLEALPRLREVYCGPIAYEIEHISDHAERVWLRRAIESGRFREPLPAEERRALLQRLSQVEGFEQYLRRSFLGQKQFSLEGLDVLDPDARRDDRARRRGWRPRGRDRDGASRPAERARPHRRPRLRVDPARVRGGALARRARRRPGGRHGRREVPPPGDRLATHRGRRDRGHDRPQPEPPRGRRPRRRGSRAGGADRPFARCRPPRPDRGAAGSHPRRRVVRRAGRRRRDAQPAEPRRVLDRRHAAPDHEQPGRVHDRPDGEPLDPLLERSREGLRRPDRPRQRRRPRGRALGGPPRARVPRPSSATTS